jgi:hypothetical protein
MQTIEISLVEIAVAALIQDDVDMDTRTSFDTKAIVLHLEARDGDEEKLKETVNTGSVPHVILTRQVSVVNIEEEAAKRGFDVPYWENPADRALRLQRGKWLAVSFIFQPADRLVVQRVADVQVSWHEIMRKKEKTTKNGPKVDWHIGMTNNRIRMEATQEEKRLKEKQEQKVKKGKGKKKKVTTSSAMTASLKQ